MKLAFTTTALAALCAMPVASLAGPDCTCRLKGENFVQGEVACIRIGEAAYMARCEMNQNVTSWKRIGDDCPTASLVPDAWSRTALPGTG